MEQAPDGTFKSYINTFVYAGLVNELFPARKRNIAALQQLSIGWLVAHRGNYFAPATFRLSASGFVYKSRLSVQPDLYFRAGLKEVFPGMRFKAAF